jgi:hypothetical protein
MHGPDTLELFDEIYPNVVFSVSVCKVEHDEIDRFEYGFTIEFLHYVGFGATGNEKTEREAKSFCCGGKSSKDVALDSRVFALVQTINNHKAGSYPIESGLKEETPSNPTWNDAEPGAERSNEELVHDRLDGLVK